MNKLSPEQDRANEQLCRSIFAAATASQEQMEAAADAPFLYQRIRNEIAQHTAITPLASKRAFFADWFAWRWAIPVLAVLLLAIGLWQWWPQHDAPPVARQTIAPASTPTLQIPDAKQTNAEPAAEPAAEPTLRASHRAAPARTRQALQRRQRQEEVTSEFIPLTYVADSAATSGHLIRIEVTPAMLASLGFPLPSASNKEWVKADLMLGDDGLARAIRFVE